MQLTQVVVLPPPVLQIGRRVTDPHGHSGLIVGTSYIYQRSEYDWWEGWLYCIEFDRPFTYCDSLPESIVKDWTH